MAKPSAWGRYGPRVSPSHQNGRSSCRTRRPTRMAVPVCGVFPTITKFITTTWLSLPLPPRTRLRINAISEPRETSHDVLHTLVLPTSDRGCPGSGRGRFIDCNFRCTRGRLAHVRPDASAQYGQP